MTCLLKFQKNMSASIIKSVFTLMLLLGVAVCGAQSKSDLEKKRKELSKKIAYTKELISKTKKGQQATADELAMLSSQIHTREELLQGLSQEVETVGFEVDSTRQEVERLEQRLETMKQEYGDMVYQTYRNRNAYDKLMYLFAAEDFNQAYKRLKIMQFYSDQRLSQADRIESSKSELVLETAMLEASLNEKKMLLAEQNEERSQLQWDKQKRESTLAELKSKEKDLLQEQQTAEKERKKVNDAIQRIIEEELAKSRAKTGSYALSPEAKALSVSFENNKGVDFSTDAGAEIFSVFDGEVTSVFNIPGAGQNIIVTHGGYKSVYTNLKTVQVVVGEQVVTGQAIGPLLSDGNKSTAHLEIWKVVGAGGEAQNPMVWLVKR